MFRVNKKKLIIILTYASFFIAIPIIKNETRLIEKKIQQHKIETNYLEKNLSEAFLEFYYLSSPEILEKKVNRNIDINYQNLNIYGWWFSLQMPNPITLGHFTVNLEKGSYPVDRRIKRVFVIATNDSVDYYKLGYFGGAGVHGSSVISSDANVAHFSYYAEQGKNMQSSPFLKYIFV